MLLSPALRSGLTVSSAVALGVILVACGGVDESPPIGNGKGEPSPSPAPPSVAQWLVDITAEAGLDVSRPPGGVGEYPIHEIMVSGVALFDYDGDGDLDAYLTNDYLSASEDVAQAPRNRLFRQEADGRFSDVTSGSGLADDGYGVGVAIGDVDNDGDEDVYLSRYGPDRLYRNRGDGTFEDATTASGIDVDGWSTSSAFFDYDLDGFLDLYVARYVVNTENKRCADNAGRLDYCSPKVFPPVVDVLLHNEGDGRFADVSERAGIVAAIGAGLGVVAEDFNEDGWPDVYVATDDWPNQYWVNQGDGTFRDEAVVMGAAYNMHGRTEAGMGVLGADLDNDLDLDLFMTHISNETNTFYRNLGGSRGFEDATGDSGLATSSLVFTGFGTAAIDLELDGDLDLLVVNGRVNRGVPRPGSAVGPPWDVFAEPNLVFLNQGGAHFGPAGESCRSFMAPIEISRGLATGDVDRDGDLDVLIGHAQSGPRLYRNEVPRNGRWLMVRARDPRYRRDAIGATVVAVAGEGRWLRTISRAYSYLSSSDPRAHFGLGSVERLDRIEVRWPDGLRERFPVDSLDREITLERGDGEVLQ
jgi:hypothetical protein